MRLLRFAVPFVIVLFAFSRGVQRVITALTLQELGPWTVSGFSLVLSCLLWLPVAARKGWLVWDRRLWSRCVPLGLVNIAVPGVAFIAAQQFVTAAAAALLVAAMPMVIALLARVFLGERLALPAVLGIVIGAFGVVMLTLGKGGALDGSNWWVGVACIAIGVIAAASVYVGWRGLLAEHQGVQILAPQLVVAAATVVPVAVVMEGWVVPSAPVMGELAALAVVNYVVPQLAMFWLLARTTAVRSAVANYLAPLFATLIAVPVLGQDIGGLIVVGGTLIVTGAVLVNTSKQRR